MSKKNQKLRVIDAPMYNYWQALVMSLYSSRLYVDVAKRWRHFGILYLLFVISLSSIPLSARVIYDFHRVFEKQMIIPISKLPLIYVQSGQVIFDKPMPFFIKNDEGAVVAIIDTTGKINQINTTYPELTILVTKDKLYFRAPKFPLFFQERQPLQTEDIYVQALDKSSNEVFNGKSWVATSGVLKLRIMTEMLIYPLLMMFIFGVYVVLMFALAFIGQLFSQIIFKFKLPYREATRILMVAATVQILVFFTLLTCNIIFSGTGLLYMLLLAVYFNYGVLSFKKASKKMVRG